MSPLGWFRCRYLQVVSPTPSPSAEIDPAISLWWVPLAVTIVGGLVVALLTWLIIKYHKQVWVALKWPFTIRLTTTKKVDAARKKAERDGFKLAVTKMKEAKEPLIKATSPNQVAQRRVDPQPRWRIERVRSEPGEFALRNLVPDSIATNVRLDADLGWFDVQDNATWSTLSGVTFGLFSGEMTRRGRAHGVRFKITWHDGAGAKQTFGYDYQAEHPEEAY